MKNNTENNIRRSVIITIMVTTLVFFAVLCAAVMLAQKMPEIQEQRIAAALAAGRADRARRIASRMSDEEKAREYICQCDYLQAKQLMEAGEWEASAKLFAGTGSYLDSAELAKVCNYQSGIQLAEKGSWDEAAALFKGLAGYEDALTKYDECRYGKAEALIEAGDEIGAAAIFSELGSFRDSEQRLGSIAAVITGIEDKNAAIAALSGLSPEEIEREALLTEAREALPADIIAVGFYHTVGLRDDGKVLACGSNDYGQCDVSSWTDITAVAAGAYHTVGLKADGTVVTAGRNSENQCDTSDWKKVVQIAAADYATFGLCADGTLLCTGFNDYSVPSGWSDLRSVSAGSYAVAALRSNGEALIYPQVVNGDALSSLVALTLNTGYAVGLRSNGTVVCTACELENWQDILAVSASSTAILGLDAEGRIWSRFFRSHDAVDLSGVSGAVAVSAGGTHYAVVLEDGTVRVFGNDSAGQDGVGGWKLFNH